MENARHRPSPKIKNDVVGLQLDFATLGVTDGKLVGVEVGTGVGFMDGVSEGSGDGAGDAVGYAVPKHPVGMAP